MQLKPFVVRFQRVYIYTVTAQVLANDVNDAQKTLSDTLQHDALDFDNVLCHAVGWGIERSMFRFIVTHDEASSSLVTVFDVHPETASPLAWPRRSVSNRRETGDLASVVSELDWTAQDFSQPR